MGEGTRTRDLSPNKIGSAHFGLSTSYRLRRSAITGKRKSHQIRFAKTLDRILGLDGPAHNSLGTLQKALKNDQAPNLPTALRKLYQNKKVHLDKLIGPSGFKELISFSGYSSPHLFHRSLLQWGEGLENSNHFQAAQNIYHLFSASSSSKTKSPKVTGISPTLQQRAKENLQVLHGGGSWGRRLEQHLGKFIQEATSPAMIVGMAVGLTAYSGVRNLILPRLLASRGAGLVTTGLGARLTASALALIPETGAFWASSKGINQMLHPGTQRWDFSTNLKELGHLAMTLSLLKSTAYLFGRGHLLAAELSRSPDGGVFTQSLAGGSLHFWNQAGMFTGITLSHGLETFLGQRPVQGWDGFLLDSLVTLAHFNIGGKISQKVFPKIYALNAQLDRQLTLQEKVQFHKLRQYPLLEKIGDFFNNTLGAGFKSGTLGLAPAFAGISSRPNNQEPMGTGSFGAINSGAKDYILQMSQNPQTQETPILLTPPERIKGEPQSWNKEFNRRENNLKRKMDRLVRRMGPIYERSPQDTQDFWELARQISQVRFLEELLNQTSRFSQDLKSLSDSNPYPNTSFWAAGFRKGHIPQPVYMQRIFAPGSILVLNDIGLLVFGTEKSMAYLSWRKEEGFKGYRPPHDPHNERDFEEHILRLQSSPKDETGAWRRGVIIRGWQDKYRQAISPDPPYDPQAFKTTTDDLASEARQLGIDTLLSWKGTQFPLIQRPLIRDNGDFTPVLLQEQLQYLKNLLRILPSQMFNGRLKEISLIPLGERSGEVPQLMENRLHLHQNTFGKTRRDFIGEVLYGIGQVVAQRYFPGRQGDPVISDEIRTRMDNAYRQIRDKSAMLGLNWNGGPGKRRTFQERHLENFLSELTMMYISAGARLRQHIRQFSKGSQIRRHWEFAYTDLKNRIFQGLEYP